MDNAIYVSLSRQVILQRALDVTANNLANVDTAGFKVESLVTNVDPLESRAPENTPIQYVLDTQLARNFAAGPLNTTGSPYDVAIEGDGFFAVQTADGVRYTRDGRFTVDPTGALVDMQGHPVQGAGGQTISFDIKKGPPSIGRDGTISQDGQQIGKLSVVRFASKSQLSKEGSNLYSADPANTPIPANDVSVRQGAVEGSNVQPVTEVTQLIAISRAYERITQIMNSASDLSKSAVDRLGKVA